MARILPNGKWKRFAHLEILGPETKIPDQGTVEQLLAGKLDNIRPTYADRAAAIDWLDSGGMYAWQIAQQIGCTVRTVQRRRVRRRRQQFGGI